MRARKYILHNNCFSHVIFRCHDQSFLLKPSAIKNFLIFLWAKYHHKYGVHIYEFIILDNHAHMLVRTETVDGLSNFMRTVGSQLARAINFHHKRKNQALGERFKSPLITTSTYFSRAMQYIWLNRFKADKTNPEYDPYCSAAWRLHPYLLKRFGENKEEKERIKSLLASYEDLPFKCPKNIRSFIIFLIRDGIANLCHFLPSIFCHSHTIGDNIEIAFRNEQIDPIDEPP